MSSIRRAWQISSSLHSADMMTDRGETLQASHQQTWLTVFTGMHDIYMYIYSVLYIYIYNNEAAVVKLHLIMFWHCRLWVELWALTLSPPPHLSRNYFNDNGCKIKESTAQTPQMWQPSCFNSVLSVIYHRFLQNQSFLLSVQSV